MISSKLCFQKMNLVGMYKTSWNWNTIKHTSYTANAVMWGKYNRVLYEALGFTKKKGWGEPT